MKRVRPVLFRLSARPETALALGVVLGAASGAAGGSAAALAAVPAGILCALLLLPLRAALPGALGAVLGAASWYCHANGWQEDDALRSLPERNLRAEAVCRLTDGRITSVRAVPAPGLIRAELVALRLLGEREFRPASGTLYLRFPDPALPSPPCGAVITAGGTLELPAESVFRQEEGELRPVRNGLSFAGFLAARGAERLFRIDQFRVERMAPGVVGRLCRIRDFLMERALRGVTSDRVRGCAAALFFGATGGIDSSIRERFVRSGTIHLFSVSGMHVAVLAGVLLWLLRPLPLRPRMLSLLLLVGAYVLTTGANPPAVRALCMIGVWCLLRMVLLYTPALNTLFLAAAAMVLVSPMLVLDLGFQYSFVITAMLILLAERFREWNELLREPLRYMPTGRAAFRFERSLRRGSALLFAVGGCVGAFLAGAGISLYSQGLLLPGSVLANLLLSPLVGALFPVLAFKLAFGALLPGLDQLGAWLLTAGFSLMDAVAGTVSTCFGRMSAVRPAAWEAVLFTGALLVAVGVRKRRIAVAAAFLAAILLAGWVVRAEIRPPSLMTGAGGRSPLPVVAVAEPGRGVGVAINMPGSDAAEAVAGFFRSNGITEVETLYLSRPRTGAVLGVPALLRAMPVRRIALPPRDSYGWRMEELLELRAAGVPVSRHAGRDPGFCRILDEKTHWEVEYFNPGSKLIFRLWIDAADSGWCFTLRRPGRPEERFLIPYGSVLEMREHVFEGF